MGILPYLFLNISVPFYEELKADSIVSPYGLTVNELIRAKANKIKRSASKITRHKLI